MAQKFSFKNVRIRTDQDWYFWRGHVEKGESFIDATIREVYEETGLAISDLH
ncbi:NUDIX domain-containing protein [Streptococcus cameli]